MKRGRMKEPTPTPVPDELDYNDLLEPVRYDFGLRRRSFVQILGAGILIATATFAQNRGRRGGFGGSGPKNLGARIHPGDSIFIFTGKVEAGQGARAEMIQAAAEELRVAPERIQLEMADTDGPDDGMTAGSGSTPRTVPSIRQAAAAVRQLLIEFACKEWSVDAESCKVENGMVSHSSVKDRLSYADLASSEAWTSASTKPVPADAPVTAVKEWKLLGKPFPRSGGRDLVTGGHKFPSDVTRPGMLYGKVLRAPSYGTKLTSIDLTPAKQMKDVVVVRDDDFVGVAAPNSFLAEQALSALTKTAKWETASGVSSKELSDYLKQHAQGGIPANPFSDEIAAAKHALKQTYNIPYVQHAPLEPRAALAEWREGKLTVWTGTQNPFGNRSELTRAFHLADDQAHVIVPDFGAAFGGKHTGEVAVEAARLAKGAGKPVSLRWTREEEFTWAYFRPAGVILAEASLDSKGSLTSWHFININSGGSAVETPYRAGKHKSLYLNSSPPLRHGSYRALAATANNFARECFMDEIAAAAVMDPLEFRLAHLENDRLRAVLEKAATEFKWKQRVSKKSPNHGIGLACGTEKGSYVAACVEIEIDSSKKISVRHVCQAFECGAIINPDNLHKQIQGAIVMGLGPALREEMHFENGQIQNASFRKYPVPRFDDVPELDVHLLDRPDLPSAGAGETPLIAIAPAIANAVFQATGQRIRSMPIRLERA